MRSRPGSTRTSSRYGRATGGAKYGSPGAGPDTASSSAALSRTLRDSACCTLMPLQPSPSFGAEDTRARVGFIPNSPQHEAGIRIEPPPSVACAAGTIPDTTADAAPPEEPPAERVRSHGLGVGAVQSRLRGARESEFRRGGASE
jgi:hypothetical protein